LLVAIVGGLILADILYRQSVSRHLLTDGVATTAETVQLNIYPNKGTPIVGEVVITFRGTGGQVVHAQLSDFEDDDPHGLAEEGTLPPPAGTRYAAPLAIIYDPAEPATVLAKADAQLWLADRRTPTIGIGMIAGGLVVTIVAIGLLTRDARRRGVSWWQWYVDTPSPRHPDT
jgi:hypothetical protein